MLITAQIDPGVTTQYLILGYIAFSLIGLVYVATLINRQRNLKQDIELMQRLLDEDRED
jgi:hypothetical protein